MKFLWSREHQYVTIPNMAVWECLVHLVPDMPDRWSFPDVERVRGDQMIDTITGITGYLGVTSAKIFAGVCPSTLPSPTHSKWIREW